MFKIECLYVFLLINIHECLYIFDTRVSILKAIIGKWQMQISYIPKHCNIVDFSPIYVFGLLSKFFRN